MSKTKKESQADQSARFVEAARELGCDESPDAFEAAVKKVAKAPVTRNAEVGTKSAKRV